MQVKTARDKSEEGIIIIATSSSHTNTKRTINPFYAPKEKIIPKSKSSLNINEYKYQNNNNFLHSSFLNNKLFPSKKRNTNLYKNNFSIDNNDEISKYMNNNNNNDFYEDPYSKKRQIKNSLFTHYKTTTFRKRLHTTYA